jgi:hypothetical protein
MNLNFWFRVSEMVVFVLPFRFASSLITTNQEILMMPSLLEKGIVEANEDLLDEIFDEQFIDDLNGQRSSRQQLKARAGFERQTKSVWSKRETYCHFE